MAARNVANLLGEIGRCIGALPDVFSTAQWGGRAFKLPGPRPDRPKLLAFVNVTRDEKAISIGFKLPRPRAADVVERHEWINPHEFGSLGRSGWVEARVRTKRQWSAVRPLLAESRALHPTGETGAGVPPSRPGRGASPEARRIDRVMAEARDAGWRPTEDF